MIWTSGDAPEHLKISPLGWLRVILRGVTLVALIVICLAILLLVRLIEKPLYGVNRPWTPHITQFVCRTAFVIMGIQFSIQGTIMVGPGAIVANHSSWLDIFALNAAKRIYFVSKDEVASWPGIGSLARATGTVFIKRDRSKATAQIDVFKSRLNAGHKLLFFPEGTSTDGLRVLPFKPTLFAAFLDPVLRDTLEIQPVTVRYYAPDGADARFYGWWGDMALAPHLLATLAAYPQGRVVVVYHPPVKVSDFDTRKTLAATLEATVRSGLTNIRA